MLKMPGYLMGQFYGFVSNGTIRPVLNVVTCAAKSYQVLWLGVLSISVFVVYAQCPKSCLSASLAAEATDTFNRNGEPHNYVSSMFNSFVSKCGALPGTKYSFFALKGLASHYNRPARQTWSTLCTGYRAVWPSFQMKSMYFVHLVAGWAFLFGPFALKTASFRAKYLSFPLLAVMAFELFRASKTRIHSIPLIKGHYMEYNTFLS